MIDTERYNEQLELQRIRKCVLRDGTIASVQASEFHYCSPRMDNAEEYFTVEAWFWREDRRFRDGIRYLTEDPMSFLPAKELIELFESHGGMVSGKLPPLALGDD